MFKTPATTTTPDAPDAIACFANPRIGEVVGVAFETVVAVVYPVAYTGDPAVIADPELFITLI